MMPRIDSHQHFWHYDASQYPWIDESKKVIRRDFLPVDLHAELRGAGLQGAVSVQAQQALEETHWLLELAEAHDFLYGVVGWVPLCSADVAGVLEELSAHPKLKAVRHVVQDERDPNFILREDFNRGIGQLKRFNLVYDILIYERHLPQTIEFVDRHPQQRFVLDHVAKPRIGEHLLSPWREHMVELAKRPTVYCKLSGMATEADYEHWREADLNPYLDTALEAFGPHRLMFGSDWPVCLVATSYRRWHDLVADKTARLSVDERERIWGGTAVEAYGL